MRRLKSRQSQIPNGFRFSLPEIKYNSQPYSSFDTIVNSVTSLVNANPAMAQQYGWPVTREGVANWVEQHQVAICEMNGWTSYLTPTDNSPPPPKFKALSPLNAGQLSAAVSKAKKVWQGVKTLNEWIDSGEPGVESVVAESRAAVCAVCPNNGKGGLEEWFTRPASEVIRRQFSKLESRKLKTSHDDKLNICSSCLCPLRLLAWVPLKYKLAHMGEETRKSLHQSCWILSEEKQLSD